MIRLHWTGLDEGQGDRKVAREWPCSLADHFEPCGSLLSSQNASRSQRGERFPHSTSCFVASLLHHLPRSSPQQLHFEIHFDNPPLWHARNMDRAQLMFVKGNVSTFNDMSAVYTQIPPTLFYTSRLPFHTILTMASTGYIIDPALSFVCS